MIKVCALIPARGGSKRVPNKNIRPINGVPLIGYTIGAAKESQLIDEVWVSTNDKQISEISTYFGANVIDRPDNICEDTSSSELALFHFAENVDFDVLVFIQATSPLIDPKFLDESIKKIIDKECDSVLSVCEDNRFYWDKNSKPINYDPLNRPRTQDKEPWFMETGSFYATTKHCLLESGCRISGNIGYVVVPQLYSFEIDYEEDFDLLESIMSKKHH